VFYTAQQLATNHHLLTSKTPVVGSTKNFLFVVVSYC